MPCSTPYDGSINDVANYLINERPKGWLGELEKLQDMSAFGNSDRKLSQKEFQIRFRHISPQVVLPQQVK